MFKSQKENKVSYLQILAKLIILSMLLCSLLALHLQLQRHACEMHWKEFLSYAIGEMGEFSLSTFIATS